MTDPRSELPLYRDWSPTQFDSRGLALFNRQHWRVAPVTQTRDSTVLEQSNWNAQLEALKRFDDDTWEVHRFGHWGPGWFEIVIVAPDSDAMREAAHIADALANYPCLDEDDFSTREFEAHSENLDNALRDLENNRDDVTAEQLPDDWQRQVDEWADTPEAYDVRSLRRSRETPEEYGVDWRDLETALEALEIIEPEVDDPNENPQTESEN